MKSSELLRDELVWMDDDDRMDGVVAQDWERAIEIAEELESLQVMPKVKRAHRTLAMSADCSNKTGTPI